MVKGFIIAVLLHGMVFALVAITGPGLFHSSFDDPEPNSVSARLVTIDELNQKKKIDKPRKKKRQEPKKDQVKQSRRTIPNDSIAPVIEKKIEEEKPEKIEPVQKDEPKEPEQPESGESDKETMTRFAYLRSKMKKCFIDPTPFDTSKRYAHLLMRFNKDGSLAGPPRVIRQNSRVLAESAQRAIINCAPYPVLGRVELYRTKGLQFVFDPNKR